MNKRTAFVYFGAAFLIIVFGFRTLARTIDGWESLESLLTPITVVALLLEFSLLVYYAYGIYTQPESGEITIGDASQSDLGQAMSKIEDLNSVFSDYTDQMKEINNHLGAHNDQIVNLNSKLEDLVDEQLDEKVRSILSSMIRK